MPRRRVTRRLPLEWTYGYVEADVSGTVYTAEIDLDLLPDEIASIIKIDSHIAMELDSTTPEEADSCNFGMGVLNMNPDYNPVAGDMVPGGGSESDLETFFSHHIRIATIITTSGAGKSKTDDHKTLTFDYEPVLVGTNIGMALISSYVTATTDCFFGVRVYFKRRRATAQELNQILLKRR